MKKIYAISISIAFILALSIPSLFSQDDTRSDYKIGPKDELEISVTGWEEVSKTVRVSEDGKIALPYLGEIEVEGMTISQLERKLSELLEKDYIQNPQVTIFISKFLSKIVYVDGAECGRVSWPRGEVVLTPHVEPGKKALLRILVVAAGREDQVESLLSGARSEGDGNSRGLVSDVTLESRPIGTRIDGVFVQTSVRHSTLTVDVDLVDVRSGGDVRFTAVIRDGGGKVAQEFESSAHLTNDAEQTVQLSWPWIDPALWDFMQPNLYTLSLKADGPGIADEYSQRFGFREFWIEGKQFLLNEKPFRLRPTVSRMAGSKGMREAVEGKLDSFLSAGFNLVEVWPLAEMTRGRDLHWQMEAQVADEKGMPLMYPALNLSGVVGRTGSSEEWEQWEDLMVEQWKEVRNHPSIVMLVCTANAFQHADDQNPRRIGSVKAQADETSGQRLAP